MDSAKVVGCYRDRTILVTGSTGFLGKLLVEKILRVQPGVKKLYLLVRAQDNTAAQHRVLKEVNNTVVNFLKKNRCKIIPLFQFIPLIHEYLYL
ncbi:hypothetical protein HU200_010277 [Digitaria exilis]|uniref:Fatty acyl-CoA reductase n=1 Tax=Digitaria exilis TaxID=1010633 RepID=A0A835KPY7_9POAL|nr:hypothetical protein HU200_010277 [Digitaria exilis]